MYQHIVIFRAVTHCSCGWVICLFLSFTFPLTRNQMVGVDKVQILLSLAALIQMKKNLLSAVFPMFFDDVLFSVIHSHFTYSSVYCWIDFIPLTWCVPRHIFCITEVYRQFLGLHGTVYVLTCSVNCGKTVFTPTQSIQWITLVAWKHNFCMWMLCQWAVRVLEARMLCSCACLHSTVVTNEF